MHIDIQTRNFTLTPALADAVHRAAQGLDALLGDRSPRIQVRLFDINGDKGGIDKVCLVTAQARRQPRMWVVSNKDADLYRAIVLTFAGLRRMVAAAGHRDRSLRRRRGSLLTQTSSRFDDDGMARAAESSGARDQV